MNFENKKILTITDGSQGMISQVNGLAEQLSKNIVEVKTTLYFPWSLIQPGFLPIFKWIFKNKIDLDNKPDIIISCGRKSVYLSLFFKKKYKKNILTIHIQNPKIDSKNFDFVIAPNHDNFRGSNIINSKGALHHFTKEKINDNEKINLNFSKDLISIIIGGENTHYYFNKKTLDDIILKVEKLINKYNNYDFIIISSRRTNKWAIGLLKEKLGNIAYVWDKKTKNPYKFALKESKYFIITSDSTSMISECAFTGKPIYIYHLPFKRKSDRIINFHNEFAKMNITRRFSYNFDVWKYETLDEAKRIAGILRSRILNN